GSIAVLGYLPLLCASVPQPSGWVPVRWPWADAKSLELLEGSPVNCLLLKTYPADLVSAATTRGLVTLAVIAPGGDAAALARAVRAWGDTPLWIANEPPPKTVVTGARYLQVIADAAISGARWVLAFDSDFARRLHSRQADALSDWRRMGSLIGYFEQHPEWRG